MLLGAFFFLGCGSVDDSVNDKGTVSPVEKSAQKQDPVADVVGFKNFEAFYNSIVFRGGDTPALDYADELDYEHIKNGAGVLYPRKYYKRHKKNAKKLNSKLKELRRSTQVFWIGEKMRPKAAGTHDYLHDRTEGYTPNARRVITELKEKDSTSLNPDEKDRLLYGYTLLAEYEKASELDEEICADASKSCPERVDLIIKGQVKDAEGNPLSGVTLSVLNYDKDFVSDPLGMLNATVSVRSPDKVRVRLSKRGYSDAFWDQNVITAFGEPGRMDFSVILEKPLGVLKLNFGASNLEALESSGAVTSELIDGDLKVVLEDKFSFYLSPDSVFSDEGMPYKGLVDLELFYFSNQNQRVGSFSRLDMISNEHDVFDQVVEVFGMPYLKFTGEDGQRLAILKKKPIIIEGFLLNYVGEKGLPAFFTRSEWEKMYDYGNTAKEVLPIDWSVTEKLLGSTKDKGAFGLFWNLRQDAGVWTSSKFQIVNMQGDIKTQFYTHE